ncbi:MAG: diacylglycerol kinase family protein [Nanoarchaeota archaeon]|nr:diacylglycerol kinase family protein [Nanoarchaeota archaeon]
MADTVLFTNMNAKGNRFDKHRVKTLDKIVKTHGRIIKTHSVEELEYHLSDLYKKNPETITIDGGDGTLLTFFTLMLKYWPKEREIPPIGLIPGGTWNVMSKHAELKKRKWKKYLRMLIKSNIEDLSKQDIGLMNIKDNNNLEAYGFSFGMGMASTLLEEYYRAKYLKLFKVAEMAIKLFGSAIINGEFYKRFNDHYEVILENGNGKKIKENVLGVMAQTIPNIGAPKSRPFYRATHSQKFHILGTQMGITDFLWAAIPFYFGKSNLLKNMIDLQTGTYKITSANKPFKYQVNGDLEFDNNKFYANEVTLTHGRTIDVIKYIRQ